MRGRPGGTTLAARQNKRGDPKVAPIGNRLGLLGGLLAATDGDAGEGEATED